VSLERIVGTTAMLLLGVALFAARARGGTAIDELHLDYAYYNPVSLVLKDKGWVEQEFKPDGVTVRWVLSLGSNKALEFLNAGGIDVGSTAGAAALLARIHGNPIRAVYVYAKPEWTALVTRKDTGIKTVRDLKGKRVAVTRGTDPHIFLIRALQGAGLTENDIFEVLLQHQDGRLALDNGDVDAWAGLDPMMAQAQLQNGDVLFYRNADLNTYGVLDVRAPFAADHPDIVRRLLRVYERGRRWSLDHPVELRDLVAKATRQSTAVATLQLSRNDFSNPDPGPKVHATIFTAGIALQKAGVIPPDVDVAARVSELIDRQFLGQLSAR
jgi:sulfonate transport system substrate-binding protein